MSSTTVMITMKSRLLSVNAGFVQAVAEMNVQLAMKKLPDRSVVSRKMIDQGKLGLVGAMYDVRTGKVMFYQ